MSALDDLSAEGQLPDRALAAQFGNLAPHHFDLATMARDTLGASANMIPNGRWADLVEACRKHLQVAFVEGVRRKGASTTKVLGSRTAPNGLPVIVTRSRIDGRTRDSVWFMYRRNPKRICDIEVDGVRASARQRAVFLPALERDGLETFLMHLGAGRFILEGDLQP